jgi:hypothetical protein
MFHRLRALSSEATAPTSPAPSTATDTAPRETPA